MANVTVRDLPEDVHEELARRASSNGQSLQRYLVAELTRLAAYPPMDEAVAELAQRAEARLGFSTARGYLEAERARR
jgi:plasmid stability protein